MLFISSYTGLGGGETSLLNLAHALKSLDRYRLHLLTPRHGQLTDAWGNIGPAHIIPYRPANVNFIPALWGRFPVVRRMADLMHREGIALVHSDYHSLVYAAYAADVPVIWTCSGWWFRPRPWQGEFFAGRVARIIASSRAIRAGFLGDPPRVPPEKVEMWWLAVDLSRFRPDVDGESFRRELGIGADVPIVSLIARFQSVKGHEYFLASARKIAGSRPETTFIIAGENVTGRSANERYKRRVLATVMRDPILREKVRFVGFRSDVERVIAASDVVVCSSLFESFGMVPIEAMACGKPVVSTNVGGPAETIVDGETGYLVPPRDPDAIADRVIRLLSDPALRGRMGRAGRSRAERYFDIRDYAARFANLVDSLIP